MTFASDRLAETKTQHPQLSKPATTATAARVSRFKFDPQQVMQQLRHRIIRQDDVLNEIEQVLQVVKADFNAPDRPLAVVLLLGSTGVGKTETVRVISEAIYGHSDAFCRIDMNTLAQEHYAAAFTGAPPGYVGSKEGHTLLDTDAIQGSFSQPGIVLFDELEKASPVVIRSLLNVLDNGRLTLSSGMKTIDFRNSLIFMTSNVGARALQQHWGKAFLSIKQLFKTREQCEQALIDAELVKQFDPEFLNRIDRILHYRRVHEDAMPALINIELNKINQRLSRQGRRIALDAEAIKQLVRGYDERYGARQLVRQMRTQLEPVIAAAILQRPDMDYIRIVYQHGQYTYLS